MRVNEGFERPPLREFPSCERVDDGRRVLCIDMRDSLVGLGWLGPSRLLPESAQPSAPVQPVDVGGDLTPPAL